MDQDDLLELMGDETGDRLWQLAEDAKNTVKSLIKEHKIDCYLRPGVAGIGFNQKQMDDLHRYAAFLERRYGYAQIDPRRAILAEYWTMVRPIYIPCAMPWVLPKRHIRPGSRYLSKAACKRSYAARNRL